MKPAGRYYPTPQKLQTNLHDEIRVMYDHIYRQSEQINVLHNRLQDAHAKIAKHEGVSTSKINGLFIKGVPPEDGQVLKYNAKTGQIEWS